MKLEEIIARMHSGKLYYCDNKELVDDQVTYLDMVFEYNHLKPSQTKEKQTLLKNMFKSMGENCYIETPFYANWGGKNVSLGDNVYANFNLVLVDDTYITIGNNVMLGPNVVLSTGTHPVEPNIRRKQAQFNLPIIIEDNVWIGANVVVMPGVTIGENSVIGAGSVVTKNIPKNSVAMGSPCVVKRIIDGLDKKYYYKEREIDID